MTDPKAGLFFSYIAMGVVVLGNILGNVFLKLGARATANRTIFLGFFGWETLVGICCFAAAVLLYAWALKALPLHIAQSIATLQFAGAITAAAIIFGEDITPSKWLGIGLICAGLMVVAR